MVSSHSFSSLSFHLFSSFLYSFSLAGIQRGSSKDTCFKGPFFFDGNLCLFQPLWIFFFFFFFYLLNLLEFASETAPSSPIVLDIDDLFAGTNIVSQNVAWDANFLELNSEGFLSLSFLFGIEHLINMYSQRVSFTFLEGV